MLNYIVWNPDGIIIDLGVYQLRWYSVLFGLGFLLGYQFVKARFKKAELDLKLLDNLAVYLVVGTILGARLGHCLFYDWEYFSQHPLEIILPFRFTPTFEFVGFRGLASHGGGVGVIIAIILYARKYKINTLWLIDTIALVVPLAGIFIRLGNLMNSEILGSVTDVSWAFVFTDVDALPRHPSQIYEAFCYLLIFVFLLWLNKKEFNKPGFTVGFTFLLIFIARFLIEFVKADQVEFESTMALNMGQWLSIPYMLAGIAIIIWSQKRSKQITADQTDQ